MRPDLPKDYYTESLRNAISSSCPALIETTRTEPDLTALSYTTAQSGRSVWISTYNHEEHGVVVDLEELDGTGASLQSAQQVVQSFAQIVESLTKWFGVGAIN